MQLIQKFVKDQIKGLINKGINTGINQITKEEPYLKDIYQRAPGLIQTYGIIDYRNDELVVQNPLQVVASVFNNKYRGNNDTNKGIWIGRRALKALPINIDFGPLQINHWSVMIDGQNFSLDIIDWVDFQIRIQQTDDKKYNWDYYGELNRDINQVKRYVEYINKSNIKYNLLDDNCQKFSLYIAMYANNSVSGIFDVQPVNVDQKYLKQRAEGLFDTFEQEERYRNETLPKILEQQKQYQEFEKQGFEMYQTKNVNQSFLGQTQRTPVTIGQTTQQYYKQPLTPYQQQQQNKLLNNITYNSRLSTNPNFNLNNQQQVVQPFQNTKFQNTSYRTITSNNYQDLQNNKRQSQFSNLNNQFQPNKKVKVDTSNFQLPDYQYDQNDYTLGNKPKYVIM